MRGSAACTPWFAVAESSLPVPLNTFAAQALKFPVPLRREFLCKALSNRHFRSRSETCRDQNCENSLIFSLLAGYLMRRRVRIGLPAPPRSQAIWRGPEKSGYPTTGTAMHSHSVDAWEHQHVFLGEKHDRHERRTWSVVALTGVMMV